VEARCTDFHFYYIPVVGHDYSDNSGSIIDDAVCSVFVFSKKK